MSETLPPTKQRLRLVFARKGAVKYISHLDTALMWERALRRAGLPLAYSQGFNPKPKIQLASGLPVGTTGAAEILDVTMNEPVDLEAAFERVAAALPAGFELRELAEVPLKAPTLQQLLRQAEYRVTVETGLAAETLAERVAALLAAEEVMETRKRKRGAERLNLRPLLYELRLEAAGPGEARLFMRLAAGPVGNLRPETVLQALGLAGQWAEIERTRLIFDD